MRWGFRNPCVVAVGAIVLGLASCEEQTPTYLDPLYQVGSLYGYVKVAGKPRAVTVGARETKSPGRVIARTRSGPDGRYEFELPVARYRIEIDPGDNGFSSPDTFNVVRVEPLKKRHDLLFGHLVLRLDVPKSMQGIRLTAQARAKRSYAQGVSQTQRVESLPTEFVFDFLDPGTSHLSLRTTSGETYWLPGTYDEDAAQNIEVLSDQKTVIEAALARYASISGVPARKTARSRSGSFWLCASLRASAM